MRLEGVALIPTCAECGEQWLPYENGHWSAYHTDDEPPDLAFFCPDCTAREFRDKAVPWS
ncbi:MAG TPA: hypothetical protein VKB10_01395 [Gaiellaceae bacterium]|nr:hypothetical protein [Gaiellaceae bacterium]